MTDYIREALNNVALEAYKTIETPAFPSAVPSTRVSNKVRSDYESWTIDMTFLLSNSSTDFAIGRKDQLFHDTVSIRSLKAQDEWKRRRQTAKATTTIATRVPIAKEALPPNAPYQTYEELEEELNPKLKSPTHDMDNDDSNLFDELGEKHKISLGFALGGYPLSPTVEPTSNKSIPRKSQFTNSQEKSTAVVTSPREETPPVITVMVKKPPERRLESQCFIFREAPFSNRMTRMDGSHVYEPPVLPLGAETTASYNVMIHAKSMWAEKVQKMPVDFTPEYALPKNAPGVLVPPPGPSQPLRLPSINGPIVKTVPANTANEKDGGGLGLLLEQPPNVGMINERFIQLPWSGKKIWVLNSVQLHELAVDHCLQGSRYQHWPGIFEALVYFQSIDELQIPLPDPRVYMVYPNSTQRLRIKTAPNENPMLKINRLVKGVWEIIKTIRIFIRTAVIFRTTTDPYAYPNDFWILCPSHYTPSVQRFFAQILWTNFNIQCYGTDRYGNCPPRIAGGKVGFLANLLQSGVRMDTYDEGVLLLWEIYMFILRNGEMVDEMIQFWELVDPPMVSYGLPVATKHQELWHNAESPEVRPDEGNDVGHLGHAPH